MAQRAFSGKALKKKPCDVSGFHAGQTFFAFLVWYDKAGTAKARILVPASDGNRGVAGAGDGGGQAESGSPPRLFSLARNAKV